MGFTWLSNVTHLQSVRKPIWDLFCNDGFEINCFVRLIRLFFDEPYL